jgi:tungstate transport system permease protein
MNEQLWEIITLTLRVSVMALAWSALGGVPLGAALALGRLPLRGFLVSLVYTGMGLPPVVVGLAVFLLFSRSGPLGGLGWLFTPAAMVVAQTLIATPLVAGITLSSLEGLDPRLGLQIRSLGADRIQEIRTLLWEARSGVVVSLIAGLGGILSEVGAAMLVGGNIEGRTRVLSTAVVLETRQAEFGLALALGGVLLSLTFLLNTLLLRLQRRRGVWRA